MHQLHSDELWTLKWIQQLATECLSPFMGAPKNNSIKWGRAEFALLRCQIKTPHGSTKVYNYWAGVPTSLLLTVIFVVFLTAVEHFLVKEIKLAVTVNISAIRKKQKSVYILSGRLFQETWLEQGYGVLPEILSAKKTSWHEVVHRQPHV